MASKTDEVIISLKINNKQAATTLGELEADAKKLRTVMKDLNPEIDKEQIAKIRAEYEKVTDRVAQAKEELGLLRKSQKKVEEGANQLGEAFKRMATLAFWIELIQVVYELAKGFFEVQKEVNALQTQISKFTGATGKELDQLVGKTQGISKAYEVEAKKVNDTANSISRNMKISFSQAQDIINKGLMASAETDKGELLDWYEEYASKLSGSRMKAEEFIATVSQMKEQGVYKDFGIDAINEFTVTATTETEKLINALKTVEQATGKTFAVQMVQDLETGKIGVTDALKQVTTELAKLPEDSQIAKQAVSEIFKSKGEEVGVAYIQNLSKLNNATEYLSKTSKSYNAQVDQLIESQTQLTATQSELFGKFQSGSKILDILTNKALTWFFRLLIQIVDFSKPLVDAFKNWARSVENLTTEISLTLQSLGFFVEEGSLVKAIIEKIASVLNIALIPFKVFSAILTTMLGGFRYLRGEAGIFWEDLKAANPRLQSFSDKMDRLGEKLAKIGNFFTGLREKTLSWLDSVGLGISQMQALEKTNQSEKPEYVSEKQKREEQVEYVSEKDLAGSDQKPDYTAKSQSYQDYLQKLSDAKKKKDDEAKKKAEELAKAETDARNKSVAEILEQNKVIDDLAKAQEEQDRKELERAEAIVNAEKERLNLEQQRNSLKITELEQNKPQSETEDQSTYLAEKYALEQEARQLAFEQKLLDTTYSEEQEFLIKEEFRLANEAAEKAHTDLMISEKLRLTAAQGQAMSVMFSAFSDTTKAIVDLFGEQTAAGKAASIAMKTFSAGEIAANAVVEISNAWVRAGDPKNPLSFIPGAAQAVAVAETIGILARKAKNLSDLAGIKFKEGGLLPVVDFFTPQFVKKLAKGGYLQGRSHAQGGIKGTGSFANFEVEGGEYITNKSATERNLPLLEAINKYGDEVDFSSMIRFATGGQLPNTTPSSAVMDSIKFNEQNFFTEAMLQALQEMGQKLDSYEREKQIVMNYSQVEKAADKMAAVRDY